MQDPFPSIVELRGIVSVYVIASGCEALTAGVPALSLAEDALDELANIITRMMEIRRAGSKWHL